METAFQRVSRLFTFPVVLFIVSRVMYLGISLMGLRLVPNLYMHEHGRQTFLQPYPAIDGLCRWDCAWFVKIVQEGYATNVHAAVCPLFPAAGWALEKSLGLHHLLTFLLLSNVLSLVSYVVVYRLFKELEGDDAARWGLLLFAAYPFAYYQAAGYAESAMVAATAATLLLAQRRHYLWAGVVLGLGVMSRQLALLGGAGLLWVYLKDRAFELPVTEGAPPLKGFRRLGVMAKRVLWYPGVLGLLIPWGFVAGFAWYLNRVLGDPLAFLSGRAIHGSLTWMGARQILTQIPYFERPEFTYYVLFAMIPTLGTAFLLTRRRWFPLASIAVAMMVVNLGIGGIALGRYSATCWPAFLPLGVWAAGRVKVQGPVLAALAGFQALFFFLFSHQFRIL